ncbi:amino acid permease-domain-containing protein [Aspergillus foveolatus]|uniref:amino acid permease-domain-containing protein n=1 Tax=Aspergillus foveolatus TaxID=210207 RepID=UPI003CCE43E7
MASNNTNGNDEYALKLDDLTWLPRDWQPSAGLGDTLRVPETSSAQPESMRSSSPCLSDSVPGGQGEQDDNNMEDIIITNHERDRVKRRLRGIHVFMITLSGVLGAGLYIRSGTVLRIGGPGAALIAFTAMGLLAWTVMQCLGELLALWPISGALVEFVAKFVDEDLGTAVGIAYWFTYSINFAALIVAAAGVLDFWDPGKAIQGTIMFFVVPLFLVLLNSFGVQIYGLTEVIGGSIKILGVLVVISCMIAINVGVSIPGPSRASLTNDVDYKHRPMFPIDEEAVNNWASALFYAFSIAAFAYVGVDITAATALEARPDKRHSRDTAADVLKGRWPYISVRFVATWTSFLVWIIYFIAGFLMSLNVEWNNENLPRLSWLGSPSDKEGKFKTDSGFVISAVMSGIPGLADMITAIIFVTAVFSANTNLYVASRTLFGLTRRIQGDGWRFFAFFGKTNNYQVPVRAMLLSLVFMWVPFLYLSPHNSADTTISSLLEVLSQMGSVSCIIVWTCECWAFIRFYNCMYRHRDELNASPQFARLRRFPSQGTEDLYPWRSHGQPVTMYLALFGCVFVLAVADGAALWHNWVTPRFLSAYLSILCFIPLWLGIKYYNNWGSVQWRLEDLSNFALVRRKLEELDEIHDLATSKDDEVQEKGWGNLWGFM